MKTFEITYINKNLELTKANVQAIDSAAATFKARKEFGYEIRGEFYPLHWSEIKNVIEIN